MDEKKEFPSRKILDQAFHQLHDQITKITVEEEEEERVRQNLNAKGAKMR